MTLRIPDWVIYPGESWESIAPDDAGIDADKWQKFLSDSDVRGANWEGERHSGTNDWGAVLAIGGRVLQAWGDPDYKFQTASVGKAFTWAIFGLAVDAGLVVADDLVNKTWTGEGLLSHPHKYLTRGHHRELKWRHLLGSKTTYGHDGGFPVTNGFYWAQGSTGQMKAQASNPVPAWAHWTGDPLYDNYSHTKPGTQRIYSSGGIWRLSQLLTVLWGDDIKHVIDDRLFSKIGVESDEWDWLPGREIHETHDFYTEMPSYGRFVDPPYEIDGHIVRGGGGWVVMSASNLARFAHLIATQGMWNGERIMSPEWLRSHGGGNKSLTSGESDYFTALGKVTTEGIDHPLPVNLFAH